MYLFNDFVKALSALEKKWFASDIWSNSTFIPFCSLNLLVSSFMCSIGTNSSFFPQTIKPEVGQGDKKEKS